MRVLLGCAWLHWKQLNIWIHIKVNLLLCFLCCLESHGTFLKGLFCHTRPPQKYDFRWSLICQKVLKGPPCSPCIIEISILRIQSGVSLSNDMNRSRKIWKWQQILQPSCVSGSFHVQNEQLRLKKKKEKLWCNVLMLWLCCVQSEWLQVSKSPNYTEGCCRQSVFFRQADLLCWRKQTIRLQCERRKSEVVHWRSQVFMLQKIPTLGF